MGDVNWLGSILLAIVLSILANLLTPPFGGFLSTLSDRFRTRRANAMRTELAIVKKYSDSPITLTNHMIYYVLWMLLLSAIVALVWKFGDTMAILDAMGILRVDLGAKASVIIAHQFLLSLSIVVLFTYTMRALVRFSMAIDPEAAYNKMKREIDSIDSANSNQRP
jgi:hypothetical protein